ncbi:hypothetical protein [Kluyvera sichuanensis]|uniref:hypothetical protein n=1 Tax=Kluyvera sichuanensis TaxID=2725494 RepID=UPI0039F46404
MADKLGISHVQVFKRLQSAEGLIGGCLATLNFELKCTAVSDMGEIMNIKSTSFQFEQHMERKCQNAGVPVMWGIFLAGRMLQPHDGVAMLPPAKAKVDGFYNAGYNEDVDECRRYLTAAGFKVVQQKACGIPKTVISLLRVVI